MGVKGKNAKTEKFDIRLSQQEEAVIKLAAALQCTSPTNFIRQQAVVAAEAVVHEQTRFVVTGKQWQTIEEAMSEPAKVLPNLQKKLLQPDDWDK
ncbi:MAG: DUF1778 domain-containing protein [Candidatus Melainabacteria bacterium]|nr:DUF1778 domain-containing protein [Candidatus Melainabacteria bacterium]